MLQYVFDYYYDLNTRMQHNTSQDAKTIAAIPGVRSIRASSYYKAPKSVLEYLIKFCIFT